MGKRGVLRRVTPGEDWALIVLGLGCFLQDFSAAITPTLPEGTAVCCLGWPMLLSEQKQRPETTSPGASESSKCF